MAALRHLRARIAAHMAVKPGGSKGKVAQFATKHGFHLSFYKHGLSAIFIKESLK